METISRLFMVFLLNAVWQIALVGLAALLGAWLTRNTAARFRHTIWVAALVLSFGLPLLTCANFYRHNYWENRPSPAASFEVNTLKNVPLRAMQVAPASIQTNSELPVNGNLALGLLGLYFLFFAYRLGRLFTAWRQTRRLVKSAFAAVPSDTVLSVIEECRAAFEIKEIRVLYSAAVKSPVAVGFFSPAVILPEAFLAETDRTTLLAGIGHEFAHVKRLDYLLNLLYEIIHLPIAFHPVAAPVKRQIKETRELSCDEDVTGKLLAPAVYARALVQLADSAINSGRTAILTIGIFDADIMEKRIMKILDKSKITLNRRNRLLLSSVALVFLLSLLVTVSFTLIPVFAQNSSEKEEREKAELIKMKIEAEQKAQQDPLLSKVVAEKKQRWLEEELTAKREAELKRSDWARRAKISMSEAIEIALRQQPGTVVESRMIFEEVNDTPTPFYSIEILFDNGGKNEETRVFVNGVDGTIKMPKPER